jgi:hypothetical protein
MSQTGTAPATIRDVMRSRLFARGLNEIRAGKPFDAELVDDLSYERGRLFGAIAPVELSLRVEGKLNPKAVSLCRAAFVWSGVQKSAT